MANQVINVQSGVIKWLSVLAPRPSYAHADAIYSTMFLGSSS